METITSRSNEFLKYVRGVRAGKVEGKFLVEGRRLTRELPNSDIAVESVLVSKDFFPNHEQILAMFDPQSPDLKLLGPGLFKSVSDTKTPQGVAAVCLIPENGLRRIETAVAGEEASIVVLLDSVSNPGNLGAVIRTCEATGVAGVIASRGSANPFSPAAVRGSMGSVFRVPVWLGAEIEDALAWAKGSGFTAIGTDPKAAVSITELNWNRNLLIAFGSEAHGLTSMTSDLLDERLRIPMKKKVESLNLAVAAGVVLFEASRSN